MLRKKGEVDYNKKYLGKGWKEIPRTEECICDEARFDNRENYPYSSIFLGEG